MTSGYFLTGLDEDDVRLTWPEFSVYVLNTVDVGIVIRLLAEQTDGDVNVRFVTDDNGNSVFVIGGIVDDIYYVETLEQKCNELGINAQFSY